MASVRLWTPGAGSDGEGRTEGFFVDVVEPGCFDCTISDRDHLVEPEVEGGCDTGVLVGQVEPEERRVVAVERHQSTGCKLSGERVLLERRNQKLEAELRQALNLYGQAVSWLEQEREKQKEMVRQSFVSAELVTKEL